MDDTVDRVRARLLEMLAVLETGAQGSGDEPLVEWLDSMGRLELVEMIEAEWGIGLEHRLLGDEARSETVTSLVRAIVADVS